VFALYLVCYTLGRGWIEALRTDDATHVLGLRINLWTSLLVFLGGLAYLLVCARLRPGRETPDELYRSPALVPAGEPVGPVGPSTGSTPVQPGSRRWRRLQERSGRPPSADG